MRYNGPHAFDNSNVTTDLFVHIKHVHFNYTFVGTQVELKPIHFLYWLP